MTAEVVIAGYACRLPQASTPDEFWRVLTGERCVVTEIGSDRWDKARFWSPDRAAPGAAYTFAAGQVGDIWAFDAGFFGISPREAAQMDPQQRMLLQAAWEAVEHAGLTPEALSAGRTGVYVGAASSDHSWRFLGDLGALDAPFMTGNTLSVISNRISHVLNLEGPSLTVDTACSSALVALDLAVKALKSGEIDTAIVGGVNALLSPAAFIGFSRAGMLSPTGLCRAFDAAADGYVRSEGAVAFVLRRGDAAAAHGDPTRGVILATGANAAGRTTGIAMPSADRQTALLSQVLRAAQADPDDLAFLEAHGAGTPVGDPAEAAAIGAVYGQRRAAPLPMGSAKTNFGHLEPAAGLVGLLKAQMALERGLYPASLHVAARNPAIPFEDLNVSVATKALDLAPREAPWLAGVNAFGFGGANAHVLIRQPDPAPADPAPEPRALTISAASAESLRRLALSWADALEAAPENAASLMNASAHRRAPLTHRLVALGGPELAAAALRDHAAGGSSCIAGRAGPAGGVAFVYAGNGAQWAGMGVALHEESAAFRAAFDEASALFRAEAGVDVVSLMRAPDLAARLDEARVAQPLLFAVQHALTRALAAEGLRPDAVAGHSVGEVAAAAAAGALPLEDAVHLVSSRAAALERLKGRGVMTAVLAGAEETAAALAEFGDPSLTLAADNSPRSATVTGPDVAARDFIAFARRRRIAAKLLDIPYPYHGPAVGPLHDELMTGFAGLSPRNGEVDFVSSVDGAARKGGALDEEYWWRNAREPVRFRQAVAALSAMGCARFIEIGPRPVLKAYVTDTLEALGAGGDVLATMEQRRARSPAEMAAEALTRGARLDPAPLFGPRRRQDADPPRYAWDMTEYRATSSDAAADLLGLRGAAPLLGARLREDDTVWRNVIDPAAMSWLGDHKVDGVALFPAAGFAEMALAAGSALHGAAELSDFDILRPLTLGETVETKLSVDAATGAVRIEARRRGGEWALHARGVLRRNPIEPDDGETVDAPEAGAAALYQGLAAAGLDYGPAFRRIAGVTASDGVARLRFTPDAEGGFSLDPTALDGAMQGIFALIGGEGAGAFLPTRIGRLRLFRPSAAPRFARVRARVRGPRAAEAELEMRDEEGALVARAEGLRLTGVPRGGHGDDRLFWRRVHSPATDPGGLPKAWRRPMEKLAALGVAAAERPEPDEGALLLDALRRRRAWTRAREAADEHGRITDAPASLGPALAALAQDGLYEDAGSGMLNLDCPYPDEATLVPAVIAAAPERAQDLLGALDGAPSRSAASTAGELWRAAETALAGLAADWPAGAAMDVLVIGAPPVSALERMAALRALSRLTVAPKTAGRAPVIVRRTTVNELGAGRHVAILCDAGAFDIDLALLRDALAPGGLVLSVDRVDPLECGGDAQARLKSAGFCDVAGAPLDARVVEAEVAAGFAPDRPKRAAEAGAAPVRIIASAEEAGLSGALEAALRAGGRPVGAGGDMVFLSGMNGACDAATRIGAALDAARSGPSRLWLVGWSGDADEESFGALGRVLSNEPGAPETRRLAFAPGTPVEAQAERIAEALSAPGAEPELIFGAAGAAAPRVEPLTITSPVSSPALALDTVGRRSLDRLDWRPRPRRAPAQDEVEIEVRAAGLNFRDVMWAQGLLPDEALEDGFAGAALGMECAGVVLRAGEEAGFRPGDEVIAFGPSALASHMTVSAAAVAPAPPGVPPDLAAGVPTIFVTALYALTDLARLRESETVLIHGAAGGVGMAALQVARNLGARVVATAGTAAKRRLLRALGAEAVFDSRALGFADEVRAATGGVDVALNSLSGEAMARTLDCLRPFGRFVELGKRDYYENTALGLRPFRRNISYFGVDADQLLAARPEVAARLMAELGEGFASGAFTPPPTQVFPSGDVEDAFRLMQGAGHVGKIVIRPPESAGAPDPEPETPAGAAPGGEAWLVTGGARGFGLETAVWLAARGATRLWLASRSGPDAAGAMRIADLRKAGVEVEVRRCDVSVPADVDALMEEIYAAGPLTGVIHAAAVVDDAPFHDLDAARVAAALAPKLGGAQALDRATRGRGLRHFIAYSSVTTFFGNPGQSAYVAANVGVEALMTARRAAGEAGLAVAWGPIRDAGMLAGDDAALGAMERLGVGALTAAEALAALGRVLAAGPPESVIAIAPMRWERLATQAPLVRSPLFERALDEAAEGRMEEGDLRGALAGLDEAAALKLALAALTGEAARILRLAPEAMDADRPLAEIGFDSLMALDLKMAAEERLGVSPPALTLAEGVTLRGLARLLLTEARREDAAGGAHDDLVASHVGAETGRMERALAERIAARAAEDGE